MSPLLLVGILISTALADVIHVKGNGGVAIPNPSEINSLVNNRKSNQQEYWWMGPDSPMKAAYDYYKKCSKTGNCLPPVNLLNAGDFNLESVDLKKNPFLNGVYEAGSSADFSTSSSETKSTGVSADSHIEINNNPFLKRAASTGNGDKITDSNGFLGVQPKKPGFSTTHPLDNKKPFATTHPGEPKPFNINVIDDDNEVSLTIPCEGQGKVCVPKDACVNGFVSKYRENVLQIKQNINNCNKNTEACCNLSGGTSFPTSINDLLDNPAKNYKFNSNANPSSGIKIINDYSGDSKFQVSHNSQSGSTNKANPAKPERDISTSANSVFSSTPDYSDVQFDSDVRFSNLLHGPAYLPPEPPKPQQCPAGTYLNVEGNCEPARKPCPIGTERQKDGRCVPVESPSCPFGTYIQPDGSCKRTPSPASCPFGTIQQPDGSCRRLEPPTPVPCPFGTNRQPDGSCRRPEPPTPAPCPYGTNRQPDGSCKRPEPPTPAPCPFGTNRQPDGSCRRPEPPTPVPCPYGTNRQPDGSCKRPEPPTPTPCPFGTNRQPDGSCRRPEPPTPAPCPSGTIQQPDGSCRRLEPSTPAPCPFGTNRQPDGSCRRPEPPTPVPCPYGTNRQPDGSCKRPEPPTPVPCPFGTNRQPDGSCRRSEPPTPAPCPFGTNRQPDGSCKRPEPPTPAPCPFGTNRQPDGSCKRPEPPTPAPCPFGTNRQPDGSCKRPEPPTPAPCPFGTNRQPDGSCRRPEPPTPAPCPYGTKKQPDGSCKRPEPPTPAPCPFGTNRQPDGSCRRPEPPTPAPCPYGTKRQPDGSCKRPEASTPAPCPFGTNRQPDGSCKRPEPPAPAPCPFGTNRQPDGSCKRPEPPTPAPCPFGTNRQPDGSCRRPEPPTPAPCPYGTKKQPDGSCKRPEPPTPAPCPFGTNRQPDGSCRRPEPPTPAPCPYGTKRQPDGSCKRPEPSTPAPCPFGTNRQPDGSCRRPEPSTPVPCPSGTIQQPDGSCRRLEPSTPAPCPFGTNRQPDGSCRRPEPSTPASCPLGTNRQPDGSCRRPEPPTPAPCPYGTKRQPDGSCKRPEPSTPAPCPFGTNRQPDGSCRRPEPPTPAPCPFGTNRQPDGSCKRPEPSTPAPCPFGMNRQPDGSCRRPEPPTPAPCPFGTNRQPDGSCKRPEPSTPAPCPFGTNRQPDGSCRRPEPPTPAPCPFGTNRQPDGNCKRPEPSTPAPCPFGTNRQPDGSCRRPEPPTPVPCPFGTNRQPDGSCKRPVPPTPTPCPFGTNRQPDGSCRRSEPPTPAPCPYGTNRQPDGSCKRSEPSTPAPCPFGTNRQPDGSCRRPEPPTPVPCPFGTNRQPDGSCTGPETPTSCPNDSVRQPDGSCLKPTVEPYCPSGTERQPDGSCKRPRPLPLPCPFGTVRQPDGSCTPTEPPTPVPCQPGSIRERDGSCSRPELPTPISCPFGTIRLPDGNCERPITPEPSCPFGVKTKPGQPCQCPAGETRQPDGSCIKTILSPYCPSGTEKQPDGSCKRPEPLPLPCKFGEMRQSDGSCRRPEPSTPLPCPPGSVKLPDGSCEGPEPSTPVSCPFGTIRQADGTCLKPSQQPCPSGSYKQPDGSCLRPTPVPQPRPCPFGTERQPDGSCQKSKPKTCPEGYHLTTSGECIPDISYLPPTTQYVPTVTQIPYQPLVTTPGKPFQYSATTQKPSVTPNPYTTPLTSSIRTYQPSITTQRPYQFTTKSPCSPGQILSAVGSCTYPQQPRPQCVLGQVLSPNGRCEYPKTPITKSPPISTNKPILCQRGQILSSDGICISPQKTTTKSSCSPGQVLNSLGACVYPGQTSPRPSLACIPGQILSSSGKCVSPPQRTIFPSRKPQISCKLGQSVSPSGTCEYPSCRRGQIRTSLGTCEYPMKNSVGNLTVTSPLPTTKRPENCPSDTKLSLKSGKCIPKQQFTGYAYPKPTIPFPTAQTCQPGQILSESGVCKYPSTPSKSIEPKCPPGQVPSTSGSECEFPKTPKPIFPSITTQRPIRCSNGTQLSLESGKCEPKEQTVGYMFPKPTPTYPIVKQRPICQSGQSLSPMGTCEYPKKPISRCRPGQVLSPSGVCEYPSSTTAKPTVTCRPGQILTNIGTCDYPKNISTTCRPGQIPSSSGSGCEYPKTIKPSLPSVTTQRPKSCPTGTQLSLATGQCEPSKQTTGYVYTKSTTASPKTVGPSCRPGQILSETGICIYSPAPKLTCPPGQVPSSSGSECEFPKTPKPIFPSVTTQQPKSCPAGTQLSLTTAKCEPSKQTTGYVYPKPSTTFPTVEPRPVCQPGQSLSPMGTCEYPKKPISRCRPGQVLSPSGVCGYPSSTTAKPTVTCRPGQILTNIGTCDYPKNISTTCRPGQIPSSSGSGCEYPKTIKPSLPSVTTQRPKSCPTGTQLSLATGQCEPSKQTTGYVYTKPTTAYPNTVRPSCRPGQILSAAGTCIYTPASKPTCPPGQVPSSSGSECEFPKTSKPIFPSVTTQRPKSCPAGTQLSLTTAKCEPSKQTTGYVYPKPSTTFPTVEPRPVCQPGQSLSPMGTCEYPKKPISRCRPGQVLSPSGVCGYPSSTTAKPTVTCRPGQILTNIGTCDYPKNISTTCRPGQIPSSSGSGCEYPKTIKPSLPSVTTQRPKSCPTGTQLSLATGQCETSKQTTGYVYTKPTTAYPNTVRPSCRPGQILSAAGTCIYTPASKPTCPPGQVPSSSGSECEFPKTPKPIFPSVTTQQPKSCPAGTQLSLTTAKCEPSKQTTGYVYPKPSTTFPTVEPRPVCQPGQSLSPMGTCEYPKKPISRCRPGQVLSPSGVCGYPSSTTAKPTVTCRPGQILTNIGTCDYPKNISTTCRPGQIPSSSGSGCEYPKTIKPSLPSVTTQRPKSCPTGTQLSLATGQCEPSKQTTGYVYTKPTTAYPNTVRPSCRPGQILSAAGTCIYTPASKPTCPPGQVPSSSGSECEFPKTSKPIFPSVSTQRPKSCPAGTQLSLTTAKCEPTKQTTGYVYPKPSTTFPTVEPRPVCQPGQSLSPMGTCEYPKKPISRCRPGQVLSPSGVCGYPSSTTAKPTVTCRPGQILTNIGTCDYPKNISTTCRPGQIPSSSGSGCEYPKTIKPSLPSVTTQRPKSCPTGTQLSLATGQCEPSKQTTGYVYTKPTTAYPNTVRPSCRPGQILSAAGTCIYTPASKPTCPPGQVPSSSGSECEFPKTPKPIFPSVTTQQPKSCPAGTQLSLTTAKCEPSKQITGYVYPKPSTTFPTVEPRPVCQPGQSLSPMGTCEYPKKPISRCRPGQVLSPSGVCGYPPTTTAKPTVTCRPGQILTNIGTCDYPKNISTICRLGQIPSLSGSGCEYPKTIKPSLPSVTTQRPKSCPTGTQLSLATGQCEPSKQTTGYVYPKSTTASPKTVGPSCRPGQILSETGICIYSPAPTLTCPPGQVPSTSGSECEFPKTPKPIFPSVTQRPKSCPIGTQLSLATGQCEPSKQTTRYVYAKPTTAYPNTVRPSCRPGQILSETGNCIYSPASKLTCPPGQVPSSSDSGCEYPKTIKPSLPSVTTQRPKSCPTGTQLSLATGQCEPSKQTTGYVYPKPTTASPKTVGPSCRPDQILSETGTCIYSLAPKLTCPPGQVPSTSGSECEFPKTPKPIFPSVTTQKPKSCPAGTRLSLTTAKCEPSKQTTGYVYPKPSTAFPTVEPRPVCQPGQSLSPMGTCEYPKKPISRCRPGQVLSPSGVCGYPSTTTSKPTVTCRPGQILTNIGTCDYPKNISTICRPGQIPSSSGSGCEYPKTIKPSLPSVTTQRPKSCPTGTQLSLATGQCEPSKQTTGYVYPKPTTAYSNTVRPSCRPGQILSAAGTCIYTPVSKQTCPPGQVPSSSGSECEYTKTPMPKFPSVTPKAPTTVGGYVYPKPTIPFEPRPQCPLGTRLTSSGLCQKVSINQKECPQGYIKSVVGDCIPSSSSENNRCPLGTSPSSFGDCRSQQCPPGSSLSPNGECTFPKSSGLPTDTNTHITPSYPSEKPYRPSTSDGYHYEKPTPAFELPTRSTGSSGINGPTTEHEGMGSNINSEVRQPDNKGESANSNNVFVSTKSPTKGPVRTPPPYNPDEVQAPAGCAAALKCVQEIYCTVEGVVSPVPVVLTKEQELLRVPTTVCRDIETGILGKCCRDPNYVDPWPSANLVDGVDDGQYKEDNFYGQHDVVNTNRITRRSNNTRASIVRKRQSIKSTQNVIKESEPTCGELNLNSSPIGPGPLDANFAQYPWQAMILRDTNRSLLCGGAIIAKDAVLTAAHCIEGLQTSDVLVKGGEWKLGIDEEPLPFQIVKVAAIIRHPRYKEAGYDLAILKLTEKFRWSKNVGSICLPDLKTSLGSCKVTGWGKRILQLHARGAIMHHIDVKLMEGEKCKNSLSERFQESLPNFKEHTLCATSDIDQCKVDYGSALACTNDQGKYVVAGIFAWDTGCKQEGQIGGYIPTDSPWIEATLQKSLKELRRLDREYLLNSRK